MELRSGKRMRLQEVLIDDPPFEPAGPSAIESMLPDDVLIGVFQQLERQSDWETLSLVSKRWCRLAALGCTKLRVTTQTGGRRTAEVLRRFGPGLQTIDLSSAMYIQDEDMRTLSRLCPNLTSVGLRWQDTFSDEGLCAFAKACGPRLLELNVSRCQGLSFAGIAAACCVLPNLRLLDISHVLGTAKLGFVPPRIYKKYDLGMGTSSIETGPACQPQLCNGSEERESATSSIVDATEEEEGSSLGEKAAGGDALSCKRQTEKDLGSVDAALASISRSCKALQTLLLKDCSKLSDAGLKGLASGHSASSLTKLDLSFCQSITDRGLLDLAKQSTKLQELTLAHIGDRSHVTPAGLAHILRHCKELTFLDLSGNVLGEKWFQQIALHGRLEKLCLNRCQPVEGELFLGVGTMMTAGLCRSTLTQLNLMDSIHLTDGDLVEIARGCVALKVLRISNCECIGDSGLEVLGRYRGSQMEEMLLGGTSIGNSGARALSSGAPWPKLQSLTVSNSQFVTNADVVSFAMHCQALTFLDAGDCHMDGWGLSVLLTSGKSLKKLMVYQNHHITTLEDGPTNLSLSELDMSSCPLKSRDFEALAFRCPNLENVDVSGNAHFDAAGLQALVSTCAQLAVLDVQDCPKVTDKAILSALQASASLRKIFLTRAKISHRLERLAQKKGCKLVCC